MFQCLFIYFYYIFIVYFIKNSYQLYNFQRNHRQLPTEIEIHLLVIHLKLRRAQSLVVNLPINKLYLRWDNCLNYLTFDLLEFFYNFKTTEILIQKTTEENEIK